MLSTSIYDLVLIYVCHFHHHFLLLTVNQIFYFSSFSLILLRYSCFYLGSQHPRILTKKYLHLHLQVQFSLWNRLIKLIFTENLFKMSSKLTSIVTILANIALEGDHIFQVLAQYSWVLPQYLRVLSRWIHIWLS